MKTITTNASLLLSCLAFGLSGMSSYSQAKETVARESAPLSRLAYNDPSLVVDLGVGLWAWPLPMDYNRDGKMDLVVVCSDTPHKGTWFFENSGRVDAETGLPLFKPAVLIADAAASVGISYADGKPLVTASVSVKEGDRLRYRGNVYPDFISSRFEKPRRLTAPEEIPIEAGNVRQNQWQLFDYDGDGDLDLSLGIDFWGDYGWDNAYDKSGNWLRGPLHGYVFLLRNLGTNEAPRYAAPEKVLAGGTPVDPYGMPSPMWADFRKCGRLDLICGEFRDGFTFYENQGTRTEPRYSAGRPLLTPLGERIHMDLCMITPVAADFNGDGLTDIICGDEDGRVAFIENTGRVVDGSPRFLAPRYFRQYAENVKFGALVTPFAFDWDGDGREDLLCGCSAGTIAFIRNLGGNPVRWAAPVLLEADGKPIREQAGANGSIQGPAEAKWGYSILSAGDWDGDGLPDIVTNGIWGKIVWYRNIGTRTQPRLAAATQVRVETDAVPVKPAWNWWSAKPGELVTQWRTTPQMVDWNKDGLQDLVMLDSEGYLALYERKRAPDASLVLCAPRRIFWSEGASSFDSNGRPKNKKSGLLQLNNGAAGKSGRRTFCLVDWDGDGKPDLIVNGNPNVNFLRGLGYDREGRYVFQDKGPLSTHVLAGHATKPTVIDIDGSGRPVLLIGAEDGFLYLLHR
jgi:hypothetical protein